MKTIRWDGAQLREVGLVKAHYFDDAFDDAFSLAMVPSDLLYFRGSGGRSGSGITR